MLTCYPCALKSSLFPTVFRISTKILKVNIKVLPYSATSSHPRLCILPHAQLHGPPCKSLNMPEGFCTCFTPFRLPPPPAFFASPALTHPPDLSSVVTTLRKASQTPISIRFFFLHELMCMCLLSCFSHGQLFCDPMDHRLPISSRQEYWSGLPCLPPGDLPNPGIESTSHVSCFGRQVLYH